MSNDLNVDEAVDPDVVFLNENFSKTPEETKSDQHLLQVEKNTTAVVYSSKPSLERVTPDEVNIEKKTLDEYVSAFNNKLEKTARSTLEMCRVVYEAKQSLDSSNFSNFCTSIGLSQNGSTTRKYLAIGKVYPRLITYAERLPASWTNIYLLTQIPADDFERLANDDQPLSKVTGGELNALIQQTKDISSVAVPLRQFKRTECLVFGTLMFTKKPDDIDWRAMKKALEEVAARLPIRFTLNQQASLVWEMRKQARYEQNKSKYESIEFNPEKWDYGRDAEAVIQEPGIEQTAA